MEYWTILLQIIPLLFLGYYFLQRKFSYWSDRGVKGPKPNFLFGNLWDFLRIGQVKLEKEWVKKYGKVYGIYQAWYPHLTIAEPEMIKQVMVKDFPVFVNRDVNRFDHEIWITNLFSAEDELWRKIRAITSPSFTTGKLRGMSLLMNQAVDKLADYFNQVIKTDNGKMNIKEVIVGFTIDVIASTSFATNTDANGERNRSNKNVFLENGIKLFELNFAGMIRVLSFFVMPNKFNKLVGAELGMDMKRFNFFVNISKEIIKQRRQEGGKVKRNDLVQLLMDAFVYENDLKNTSYENLTATDDLDEPEETTLKNTKPVEGSIKRQLTENEIIAQCILFFVAGYETTATSLSNALYNLAINQDVQDRLADELSQALDDLSPDSPQYFETVNKDIPYLEAVIKETLRIAPPVSRLQRRVDQDNYNLGGVVLEKETIVDIAVYAIHHDEDYYPEPERFNPDRFMPENKHNLVPYTYLPFGAGPRNCIGMRFAYQEIRLCLAKIIQQFRFHPAPETKIPLEYNKLGILSCKNIPLIVSKR